MTTSISNTPDGFIVEVYFSDGNGGGRWAKLRNFGDRQGDAIEFSQDVSKLDDLVLRGMERTFNPNAKYKRIAFGRYARQ